MEGKDMSEDPKCPCCGGVVDGVVASFLTSLRKRCSRPQCTVKFDQDRRREEKREDERQRYVRRLFRKTRRTA
jgi:hypothetical protein